MIAGATPRSFNGILSSIVEIIDATGENLLWRGISARTLREGRSPEERANDVMEIVTMILQQFPPVPK